MKVFRLSCCLCGVLIFGGIFGGSLSAQVQQVSQLSGTFWLDLNLNLVVAPYTQGKKESVLAELILKSQSFVRDEASYVFHGMIYGFQVVYGPSDRFHQQEETILITPENPAIISPTDLEIYHTARVDHRYYYSIRKRLSRFESATVEAWRQGDKATIQASGSVPYSAANDETGENLDPWRMIQLHKYAIDNAIKNAIRSYFRRSLRSKPAKIQVNVALSAVPELAIGPGKVLAKVRLHIGTYAIDHYKTH